MAEVKVGIEKPPDLGGYSYLRRIYSKFDCQFLYNEYMVQ